MAQNSNDRRVTITWTRNGITSKISATSVVVTPAEQDIQQQADEVAYYHELAGSFNPGNDVEITYKAVIYPKH